ncbi:hypothetical protein [Thermaurantiacus sp.]
MHSLISRIRTGLQAGSYPNEATVSTSIVVPLLRELGWDDSDPTAVCPQYTTGRGRVDYALFPRPGSPAVFVEVKAVGRTSDADLQLFTYAFHEGAQIAVLTDGRIWSFYLPGQFGSYDERRVYQLDLLERDATEAEHRIHRYLARDRVVTGVALADAQADYHDQRNRREAERILPRAWSELLAEPDPDLVEMLRSRAEVMSGHRPTKDAIEAFLHAQVGNGSPTKPPKPLPASLARPAAAPAEASPPDRPAGGANRWRLRGRSGSARDQVEAWVGLLTALFETFPDRQENMAAAVRTRSRNNIAREIKDIYPAKPEIALRSHRLIVPGWYVGTHESSVTKLRIARAAAGACGLAWGDEVDLELS